MTNESRQVEAVRRKLQGKLTPDEWLALPEFAGIDVLDPDGWDRANYEASWAEPLSRDEMIARVERSTCGGDIRALAALLS